MLRIEINYPSGKNLEFRVFHDNSHALTWIREKLSTFNIRSKCVIYKDSCHHGRLDITGNYGRHYIEGTELEIIKKLTAWYSMKSVFKINAFLVR